MEKKYCPLSNQEPGVDICQRDYCAWWDGEKCAVLGLNESLFYLIKTKEGKK